ncbi:MAG: DUF6044 family protein [Bacteroidota bacterium]
MKPLLTSLSKRLYSLLQIPGVYWGLVFLYLSPYLLGPEVIRVSFHDNLDGMIPSFQFLANSNVWFASNSEVVSGFLHSLPRATLGSEFNVILWLFAMFPPYWAYAINMILIHVVAFGGTYLLLRTHLLKQAAVHSIGLLALFFGLLPFWPSGGLSIAGQPLVVYAVLNLIHRKQERASLLILFLYPFYSHFFWAGIFFFGLLILVLGYSARKAPLPRLLLSAIGVMGILHIMVEYRLFLAMFFNDFHFHREAFQLQILDSWREVISLFVDHLKNGYYQSLSLHFGPMLVIFLLSIIPLQRKLSNTQVRILGLMGLLLLCSGMYAMYQSFLFVPIKESISLINTFDIGRTYTLYPILWLFIGALATRSLMGQNNWIKGVLLSALLLQTLYSFTASYEVKWTYLEPTKNLIKTIIGKGIPSELPPTFNGFYCVDNFERIRDIIGDQPKGTFTGSIGFHPAVSLFNGFNTIDGYIVLYPLAYKNTFRTIIAEELAKSQEIQAYFDDWGSRCYLFSAEVGKNVNLLSIPQIQDLALSVDALRQLGVSYLFSAVPIEHLPAGIHFLDKVDEANQAHPIYIFMIEQERQPSHNP